MNTIYRINKRLVNVVIFRAGYFALTANIKADISFFQEEDIIEKIFSTAVIISADYSRIGIFIQLKAAILDDNSIRRDEFAFIHSGDEERIAIFGVFDVSFDFTLIGVAGKNQR